MIRLLIGVLLMLQTLAAQVVVANNCVHKAGDNPEWARPDFDDSRWSKAYPAIGSPYVWTRCRVEIGTLARPLEIVVRAGTTAATAGGTAWELFADGQSAGAHGDLINGKGAVGFQQRRIPSGAANGPTLTVALRQLPGRSIVPSVAPRIVVGDGNSVSLWRSDEIATALWRRWPTWSSALFALGAGMILILLFLVSGDGSRPELLWFGIYSLSFGALRLNDSYLSLVLSEYPYWLGVVIWGAGNMLTSYTVPRLFFSLGDRRVPLFYSVSSAVCIGLAAFRSGIGILGPIDLAQHLAASEYLAPFIHSPTILLTYTAAVAAFWPLGKVRPELRLVRNLSLLFFLSSVARLAPQLPGLKSLGWLESGTSVQASLFFGVTLSMFAMIARQHQRVVLDRAELQGEMKAAQEVQRLLTPATLEVAPWAKVEIAYLPAKEVGGDFYFCRQTENGQLLVVGDVSGKGLRAAMLASVAIGSLRMADSASPARILREVNAALHGQTGGGFVTCCAAILRSDGQMVVANAGHPLPYVDGHEFAMESGLPLGIVADSAYEESVCTGDAITLVSDGVVEAANGKCELYGFERTCEISGRRAAEIAEIAKAWGQNDDITVVTARRLA